MPALQRALRPAEGESTEIFPYIPTAYRAHHLFFKILIFACVCAAVLSVLINILTFRGHYWCIYVLLGILCFWIALVVAVCKRRNIPKNILSQVVALSVLAVLWDWFTGWRGWSIDYVMPIACICAIVAIAVLSKVMKAGISDYMAYLLTDIVFSIVPVVLYAAGALNVIYPSLICTSIGVISFAALLIFWGHDMAAELNKRLHI